MLAPAACQTMIAGTLAKLLIEASIFTWLRSPLFTPLKRTAVLLTGELALNTFQRFFVGLVGGVLLPWLLVSRAATAASGDSLFLILASVLAVFVGAAGELLERYLFFTAVVAPKMPGVPAS
jgi:hypothetical protein